MVSGGSLTLGCDGVLHTHFNNSLYAINRDGSTKWVLKGNRSLSFDAHIEGSNNTVISTLKGWHTEPDVLLALDGVSGSIMWKRQMDQNRYINGHPVLARDGTIYLSSGLAHCVNGTTIDAIDSGGEVKWTFTTAGCASLLNIGADGVLFVMSGSSLDALEPATGTVRWSAALGDGAGDRFDVFTRGEHVFIFERNHTHSSLSSVSNEDGSTLWNHPFSLWRGDARTNPWTVLGHNDEVYVNDVNLTDGVCGLGVFDFAGNVLRKLPCLPDSPSYSYEEDLFVTIPEGNMVLAHSGTDGRLLWNVSFAEVLSRGANFGRDGTVFVWTSGQSASAHAYAIRNGNVAWSVQTGGAMEQIMSEDGTTYVQGMKQEKTSQFSETRLEIVAVRSDGVEKWRYTPAEATAVVV